MVEVTDEERTILMRWKKRSDTLILPRIKSEAVLYISEGVDIAIVAKLTGRSVKTVKGWIADWSRTRLQSVVTGHAENENAAKLTLAQKKEVADMLKRPPSESGITANFWDIPALHDVVEAKFRVTYESDATYRMLMHFAGMSFKLPDAYDKRRDEAAITARMAKIRTQVAKLLTDGYEVYTLDEVRVEHESETRRIWLPRGERTKLYVDRKRAAQSFFGALSLTTKRMKIYPIDGKQNAEAIILAMTRLQRETTTDKIAVVLDNAGFHHAKKLTDLYETGESLDRITPIYLPPYAPDHNPTEHVWNAAKGEIANLQRDTSEQTFNAFIHYVEGRPFDYDFEHLPIPRPEADFV
ncbi:MAG: IS630 family transposase [Acidipropionibacterium sp.]|nr:IS630 family transposase [Acidipropionibacterium sp.]